MRTAIGDYMGAVSKYRSHIMGFAIVCILFFHGGVRFAEPWNYFLNLLWGVDIFFFCTGMGIHRSLSRNGDVLGFYKRRISRIYPMYWRVVIFFFIPVFFAALREGWVPTALKELLGNLAMLGWINGMGHQFNWYPQAICLVYLAAPALFLAVRRFGESGRKLALFFGFFVVTQICFFNSGFLILYSRLLYFIMGLIAAELAERGSKLKLNVPVLLVCFVAGNYLMYYGQRFPTEILWGYGLSWYPGLLIVPGALWLLTRVFALCERAAWAKWVNAFFELMGKWSFEIFLVHLLLFGWIAPLNIQGNWAWLGIIAFSAVLAIGCGKLQKLGSRRS